MIGPKAASCTGEKMGINPSSTIRHELISAKSNGAAMTQFLMRTVLIAAGASVLAACTTTPASKGPAEASRPAYPTRLPEAATPNEPPPPQARPTDTVEARPLAPPPGAQAQAPRPPQPTYLPPPPARPAPVQTVTRTSVAGKVVDAAGPPKTYKVEAGDNVYRVAKKLGVSQEQLAKDNNLKSPFTIRPGQTLKGPSSKAKAYVVGSGDTLFAIGRRFSVSAQDLAEANDISIDSSLRVGQRLVLPDGYKDKGPTTVTVRVATPEPAPPPQAVAPPPPRPAPPVYTPPYTPPQPQPAPPPPIQTQPAPPPRTPPVATPLPATPSRPAQPQPAPPASTPYTPFPRPTPVPGAPPPVAGTPAPRPAPVIIPSTPSATDAQISQLGRGRFVWPLRGAIVSDFGPKGTGQRNDGINIKATAGEPVRAAAAGEVVYAGDQVPGFGNLVLVKHPDGWVSAYGHLSRVDVKIQDKVGQGQQLGQAGATGGVPEPQLHFEIRYAPTPADRARPINPTLVLPK